MRSCFITLKPSLGLRDDLKGGIGLGREAHKRRDMCIIMADSRWMAETNRTL